MRLPTFAALGCVAVLLFGSVGDAPAKAHPRPGGRALRSINAAPNRELAATIAQHLLGTLVLPAQAAEAATDPSAGGLLAHNEGFPATPQLVTAHRFWRVPGSPTSVLAWLKTHIPAGAKRSGEGSIGKTSPELNAYLEKHRPPPKPIEDLPGYTTLTWWVGYSFPEVPGLISYEMLQAAVAQATGGGTALRADSGVVWLIPRPASERIPTGIRVLDVKLDEPRRHLHVARVMRSPAAIHELVAHIERLDRGGGGVCVPPASEGDEVELAFRRSASVAPVARVRAVEDACAPAEVWVRGRRQPDLSGGYQLVDMVNRLLRTRR